jgi:hypothetical protein
VPMMSFIAPTALRWSRERGRGAQGRARFNGFMSLSARLGGLVRFLACSGDRATLLALWCPGRYACRSAVSP